MNQVAGVGADGGVVVSNVQVTEAAPTTTTTSYIQQDYCNEAMQLPNYTVCCDRSSGLWVPAPVIRDAPVTVSVSAACPTFDSGSGSDGIHF